MLFLSYMKKVLVFGTFDIFHPGHEYFLREAKKHGNELVVVIARDSTVKVTKGSKPVHDENYRLNVIQKLCYVDKAMLGYEISDKYKIIEDIKPDIICLGYDQEVFTDNLEAKLQGRGLNPEIVRLKPYMPHVHKSRHYKEQKQKD
jgi:FAD synthetase